MVRARSHSTRPMLAWHPQHLPTDTGCAPSASAHPCSYSLPCWGPPHSLPCSKLSGGTSCPEPRLPGNAESLTRCQGMVPAEAAMAVDPWGSVHRLVSIAQAAFPALPYTVMGPWPLRGSEKHNENILFIVLFTRSRTQVCRWAALPNAPHCGHGSANRQTCYFHECHTLAELIFSEGT